MDFLTNATLLAALAVVVVQQVLKLNAIPGTFANRWPVPTNIVLSVLAAVYVDRKDLVVAHTWTQWIGLVATVSIAAAITYNMTIKNWTQLRAMESPVAKS